VAISAREAERIHNEATAAGISDALLEDWTEEAGGYRYAITGHGGAIKASPASAVRRRIKDHAASTERAVLTAAAEAAGITPPPAPDAPLATEAQVNYIIRLLDQRRRTGEGGGFYSGPTGRPQIAALTRQEASLYIRSLKGDY
jgi:hypothetical protein